MKQIIGFLSLVCFLFINPILAANPAEYFAQGLQAQQNQRYEQAIVWYDSVENQNFISSELFNNKGLCYYHLAQVGKAVLNFERALLLNPYNPDAAHNLKAAQQAVQDKVKAAPAYLPNWGLGLGTNFCAWGFILCNFGLLGCWFFYQKSYRYAILSALFACSLLCLTLGFYLDYQQDKKIGVLTKTEFIVRTEPNPQGGELLKIYEGESFELLKSENGWHFIRLADGTLGWLPALAVENC